MKLFDFVLRRNGAVELVTIEQPTREFDTFFSTPKHSPR